MRKSFFLSLSNLVSFFAREPYPECAMSRHMHSLSWKTDNLLTGTIEPSGALVEIILKEQSPESGKFFTWEVYVGTDAELREVGLKANGWSTNKRESIARAELAAGLMLAVYRLQNSNGKEWFGSGA